MEPKINVGILHTDKLEFELRGCFAINNEIVEGWQNATIENNLIKWNDQLFDELIFSPSIQSNSFLLKDVVIGVNFHWERKENQCFLGALRLVIEAGQIVAINSIELENYLTSVISSEMSATASLELLKAHAVISRSWLLAQLCKSKASKAVNMSSNSMRQNEQERVVWYDREDHVLYDVCADDHCQRYQGITRTFSNIEVVKQAIAETRGEVLMSKDSICDARFSKCCGGVVEEFQNCWEDVKFPYLVKVRDADTTSDIPDLTDENNAVSWITTRPDAFCDTQDVKVLSQVLNNYDQETTDFYRWQVVYTRSELSALIKRRSGIDFGTIQNLIPIERGVSGRLIKLKIIGTKKTLVVGKELEIRRILSESHLYSSAFVISIVGDIFVFKGAGWGHGVGLCQIGAAVMGEKGYNYKEILLHYYIGASLEKNY